MTSRFSRRLFNRYAALGALAAPVWSSLRAEAQTAPIKRLFVMATSNGTIMDQFFPAADGTFNQILKPLEGLKSKISVLRGLDMKSAAKTPIPEDHWPDNYNMLTAMQPTGGSGNWQAGGQSIDQRIAKAIGAQTRYPYVHLGVLNTGTYCNRISFTGPGQPVASEVDPRAEFTKYFSNLGTSTVPMQTEAARLAKEKKSMLDGALAEVNSLRCQLGSEDRVRLDLHLSSLRDLEKNITPPPPPPVVACSAPTQPAFSYGLNDGSKIAEQSKFQLDIAAALFACDLTRVVVVIFDHGSSRITHSQIPGVIYDHHDYSHGDSGQTDAQRKTAITAIDNWYAQQLNTFLTKLDSIKEGTASILDNSACLWAHEQSNGGTHQRTDMPYVLAGSAGGFFKPGRAINFGGKPHARLLSTLATAVGVPTTQFGDTSFDSTPLTELS